jgi:hypothetical protein
LFYRQRIDKQKKNIETSAKNSVQNKDKIISKCKIKLVLFSGLPAVLPDIFGMIRKTDS